MTALRQPAPPVPASSVIRQSPSLWVREAGVRFGIPAPARPANPGTSLAEARQQLLDQAVEELRQAIDPWDYPSGTAPAVDVAAVAAGLANVALVTFGTAAAYGIALDPVIAEVHRANLTQRGVNAHGHARQGNEYSAPDVAAVMAGQRDGSDPSDRGWWADHVLEAAVPVGEEFDPELAARWLDEPHDQLGGYAPWTAITDGRGDLIWRNLATLCDLRVGWGVRP